MKKPEKFNRESLKETRDYLEKKFAEIYEETGIMFGIGNIRFSEDEFSTTLEGKLVQGGNAQEAKERKAKQEWDTYCRKFGLNPEYFGMNFLAKGEKFKIIGIKKYAETYPILAENLSNGKVYKFPTTNIKMMLEAAS